METTVRRAIQSFRSSTPFITLVVAYAIFTDQFLFAAIIPVVPFALRERAHVPQDRVQFWISLLFATFGLACFVTSAPWGWLADQTKSRQRPFAFGLLVLLAATILLWLAPSTTAQIIGRALQGFASTVVWTTGLAVLVDTVGQRHIGEYMGYVGIALNAGSLIAPLMGGIVFAKAGYNAVFGLIIGVVGLDILFRLVMVEKRGSSNAETTTATDENMEAGLRRHSEPIAGTSDDTSSINTEKASLSSSKPCSRLPSILRLLASSRMVASLWGTMVLALTFSGFQAVLPLQVNATFGWDAVGGGLIFLPLSLPALLGPVVGRFTDRYGGRYFACAGFALLGVSLILLRLVENNTAEHKALLCVLLFSIGCCMTLTLEPLLAEISFEAASLQQADEDAGLRVKSSYCQAYALFNMAWSGGCTIGPLWAGLVVEAAGWQMMTLSLGMLGGATVIPIFLLCDGWFFSSTRQQK